MGFTPTGSNKGKFETVAELKLKNGGFKFQGRQEIFFEFKEGETVNVGALGNRDPDNRVCKNVEITRPNGKALKFDDKPSTTAAGAYGTWRPVVWYEYQCTVSLAKTDTSCSRCTDCDTKKGVYNKVPCKYSTAGGFMSVTTEPECGKCGPECGPEEYEARSCANYPVRTKGDLS